MQGTQAVYALHPGTESDAFVLIIFVTLNSIS